MPPDERKRALFNKRKDLLDTFLSRGAIDRRKCGKCPRRKYGKSPRRIAERRARH